MIFMENKRSNLPNSAFGAKDRRFPLDTEQHVRSAIRLFGHAKESEKHSLAKNIKSAADKYGINIPETTQVYKYLNESYFNEDVKYEMIYNTIMNELRDNGQDPKIDKKDLESFKNIGRTNNSDFDYKVCICNLTGDYDTLCSKINKKIKPLGARLSPDNYGTAFINIDEQYILNEGIVEDIKYKNEPHVKNIRDYGVDNLKKLLKKMQTDCIQYLKKYSNSSQFKNKYKKYMYMVDIIPEEYGDPYSIQITDYQNGIDPDSDDINNKWYTELLHAGEKYLKDKYKKEISKYAIIIDTGEGDECNIYINLKYYMKPNGYIGYVRESSIINENYMLSGKDMYINFDKFESGKSNVVLITGFSGSGKSTIAQSLSKKMNCYHFELDCLSDYLSGKIPLSNVRKSEPALYDFIKNSKLDISMNLSNSDYYNLYRDYIKFIINWCKNHKNNKYIIDGLQIYEVYEDGDMFITSNPLIIKNTSAIVSAIRGAKRNDGSFINNFKDLMKWAINDSKQFKKLKNDLKESYMIESTSRNFEDIVEFNKKLNNMEYIIVTKDKKIISDIKSSSFEKYETLNPIEFPKFNGGICWDYVMYESYYFLKYFKNVVYKTFFICNYNKKSNPTHTVLLFYNNNKCYWFESSWKSHTGIYEFNSEDHALSYIIKLLYNDLQKQELPVYEVIVRQYDALDPNLINISGFEYMNYMDKLNNYNFNEIRICKPKIVYNTKKIFYHNESLIINEYDIIYNVEYSDISWWYVCNVENPSDIDEEQYYKSLNDAIKYYTKPEEFNNQSRVRKYVFTNGNSNNEDGVPSLVCLGQIWVYYYEDDDKYDYEWIFNYPIKKGDDGSLENIKEFSMASINPIVGISKPYVLKVHDNCGGASNCKYALGTDIISDKYVVVNDKSNLEVVDKSCLDDCFVEEYEFIGDKKLLNKINKAYQEQKVVDNTFIYTALTGKPLLCSDQIDFDENFVRIDFDLFKENNNTIKATFQHEASIDLNDESNAIKNEAFMIPEYSIMEDKLRKKLNRYESISLMQDENGYFLYGNITKKYSKKVESMNLITEAMINSVL